MNAVFSLIILFASATPDGVPATSAARESLADYLEKGTVRTLSNDASQVVCEYALGGEKLLVMENLTDRPLTVLLPGYDGVFHEFRGHRTFAFSAFATQMRIGADLAPHETIYATTDAREHAGGAPTEIRQGPRRTVDRTRRVAERAQLVSDREKMKAVRPLADVHEEGVCLRFGVLADTHLLDADDSRAEGVRAALRYMDGRKADGVVICGDLTQNGTIPELWKLAEIWDEVFPSNRRSDGQPVEKLFAYGDHDVENFTSGSPGICRMLNGNPKRMAEMKRDDIALNDRAVQWKTAFGEDFAPVMRKTVRGYDFVLAHLYNDEQTSGLRYADPLYIPGLEEFFATNRFDKARPLFYVQHKLLKGTVGGPDMPGQDSGRTSAILKDFPNAVAFSGHKHRSARDERMLWQGAFTAIEAPGTNPIQTEAGYENGWSSGDRPTSEPARQMAHLAADGDVAQGLFVTVYDDRMIVERREFLHGGEVAAPWIVNFPNDGEAAYERRAARPTESPRFGATASVTARETEGKDRDGKATRQIVVTCPAASDGAEPRPYAYEFRAILTKGFVTRTVASKRVFSPRAYLAAAFDEGPVTCVFAKSEIPSDHDTVVFEVVPVDAFGRFGAPIRSKPQSFNPTPSCLYPF